jgi:hypothetical protein
LDSLDVPYEPFKKLQDLMVHRIEEMTEDASVASEMATTILGWQVGNVVKPLLDNGFSLKDPFIEGLLKAVQLKLLRKLREKVCYQITFDWSWRSKSTSFAAVITKLDRNPS